MSSASRLWITAARTQMRCWHRAETVPLFPHKYLVYMCTSSTLHDAYMMPNIIYSHIAYKYTKKLTSASVTDWCMSPHGIAGPQNQSSPNSGKKCPLAKPLTMQNFVAIGWEMPEIYVIENLCSPKKWAKIHQNQLRPPPHKASHHAKFHWETTLEKSVTNFLHPSIFWLESGTPWAKGNWAGCWGTSPPPLATCKILSRSDVFSSSRYCRFCCRRDPQKTYSKRHVSA